MNSIDETVALTEPNFSVSSFGAGPSDTTIWQKEGFTLRAEVQYDVASDTDWHRMEQAGFSLHTEEPLNPKDLPLIRFTESSVVHRGPARTYWGLYHGNMEYIEESKERIRRFMRDEWSFIGVTVTASKAGVELGRASVWGIESDSGNPVLNEVAGDLQHEAITEAKKKLEELCLGEHRERVGSK